MSEETHAAEAAGLPALAAPAPDLLTQIRRDLSPALRIMLDERLYEQVKRVAGLMSRDTVFTPKHLQNKPEACFTVVTMALNANLDPHFVGRCTYQTPGGSIGFEGKLVQAILETGGRFIGAPKYTYTGDWSALIGKYEEATSQRGNKYIKRTWTDTDAKGLGVRVSWQVKDEAEPRYWPGDDEFFYLVQCFPLNSTLWATDPKTQIRYLALRRFADGTAPGILGGMTFDVDNLIDASEQMRDVTPQRPTRDQFAAGGTVTDVAEETGEAAPEPYEVVDLAGEVHKVVDAQAAGEMFVRFLDEAERQKGEAGLTAIWESNPLMMTQLEERFNPELSKELSDIYGLRRQAAEVREAGAKEKAATAAAGQQTAPLPTETAAASPSLPLDQAGPDPLFVPLPKDATPANIAYWRRQMEALVTDHPDKQTRARIKIANEHALLRVKATDMDCYRAVLALVDGRELDRTVG